MRRNCRKRWVLAIILVLDVLPFASCLTQLTQGFYLRVETYEGFVGGGFDGAVEEAGGVVGMGLLLGHCCRVCGVGILGR